MQGDRFLVKAVLLLASIAVSVGFTEWALRRIYATSELHLFRENGNGDVSYRLRPHLDVTTKVGGQKISIKTNSHGMRWREVSVSKSPTKRRVAFVGDSFTFGQWADSIEHSFVGVFENKMDPNAVEALNFGVPGYGLSDVELLIREQVLQFRPDYIILVSYNGNDFLDTYLGLDRYAVSNGALVASREVLERKVPEEFRRGKGRSRRSFIERAYVARLATAGLNRLFSLDTSSFGGTVPRDRSYTSNLFWSQTRYPEFAVKAKEISLETLARITALCRQHQVELQIATMPSIDQVRFPAEFGEDYRSELPQRYVAEFAANDSVPFLDLLPGLVQHLRTSGREVYYLDDGHLNTEGHRVVGGLLSAFFTKQTGRVRSPG